MTKAFIFGKFFPFHNGHKAMISFSFTKCDFLSIMVCHDKDEHIDGQIRKEWIKKTFPDQTNIEVTVLQYDSRILPNTSETSAEVSQIWAAEFSKHFPDYDLLITSEPYGELVADFMGIQHILFDLDRKQIPISATLIRNDLLANWRYLPKAVQHYFSIKVVILGTESTGKTTLGEQLAKHFDCSLVSEAGRDLIQDSTDFSFDDLLSVAKAHAEKIENAVSNNNPLIIIDTDIHITQSYAKFMFNRDLQISDYIYNINKADLYLYLNNDVPYVQDGTRLNEKDRDLLDLFHRNTLKTYGIYWIEIVGPWQNRFEQAAAKISELLMRRRVI